MGHTMVSPPHGPWVVQRCTTHDPWAVQCCTTHDPWTIQWSHHPMPHGLYNVVPSMAHGPYNVVPSMTHGHTMVSPPHAPWVVQCSYCPWIVHCLHPIDCMIEITPENYLSYMLPYKYHYTRSILYIGRVSSPKTFTNSVLVVSAHLCHLLVSLAA